MFQANKYPWLVTISEVGYPPHCGGTLVASNYVITAAHCFVEKDRYTDIITKVMTASEVLVGIGDHDVTTDNEYKPLQTIRRSVSKLDIHKDYVTEVGRPIGYHYDIAILRLQTEVDLQTYTPACLARTLDKDMFYGKKATVAGWGVLADPEDYDSPEKVPRTKVPYEVEVPVTKCQSSNVHPYNHPTQICAGYKEGQKDACQARNSKGIVGMAK